MEDCTALSVTPIRRRNVAQKVETFTPSNVMTPVGPYSHIAKAGNLISISATAGVDPATGKLAGDDIESQVAQIIKSFTAMLGSVNSGLDQITHINVFLTDMANFDRMNNAYAKAMGKYRPARTAIGVTGLPKPGALVTMNLTAIERD
jgi:2-iminobutanoate/2-iminopropanoate deaminase